MRVHLMVLNSNFVKVTLRLYLQRKIVDGISFKILNMIEIHFPFCEQDWYLIDNLISCIKSSTFIFYQNFNLNIILQFLKR